MRIEIETTYDAFKTDLNNFLGSDKLKIGDNEWSYKDLAEMWQAETIPDNLYFNHGSYFKVGNMNGIDYVANLLKSKPTSNRIVLPTYNMKNVNDSQDDKTYLPSLVSIQFGKNNNKLIVHMHLRALEANRFLKINIFEILYLLNRLKDEAVDFENINIIISAFRVQKKENFNCFLKAQIDMLNSRTLVIYVARKNLATLVQLFKEKKDAKETITNVAGIEAVYNAIVESNSIPDENGEKGFYPQKTIELLKKALDVYKKLDKLHKRSSIQSEQENKCEKEIDQLLDKIIISIENLKEGKTNDPT